MSASSQDEEGHEELQSEQDEEKAGSPTETKEGSIQSEEKENGVGAAAEEAREADDVVVKKSAEELPEESIEASLQTTEASPEAVQASMEPTEASMEPTEVSPGPTEVSPGPTEVSPEPTKASPEPTKASPEPKKASPEPKKASPEPTKASPEPTKASPKPKKASPEPKKASPEPKKASPEPKKASPEPKKASPEPTKASPETLEPFLESPEPSPESPEPSLQLPEPSPEASMESTATSPDTTEASTKPKEASTDEDIKRASVDISQKSTEDVTKKTEEEEGQIDKSQDFAVESIEEVEPKTEEESNGLFPRELLMSSTTVTPEIEDIPRANSEAWTFFSSITDEDLENLVFNDSLITTSDEGELGEFVISIEKCTFQEEECFSISAKSIGSIEGILCGTSLIAYVDKKLQTIEQRHHEYVELNKCPLDRKTLITQRDGVYMFTKSISEGETTQKIKKAWNISDLPILIFEGANTLLLRLLITKGITLKNFFVPTLDSDGFLCISEYKNLEMKKILVNRENLTSFGLQRSIFSKIDSPISWNYFFMDDGHLLSRTQLDSHVRMRVTTLPVRAFPAQGKFSDKPVFKKQPLNLDEDMEMRSKFLDKKDKFMNDFSVYLQQKPEIRSLLADFLQFLLLRKPDDVVKFAAEYFSSFSTHLVQPPTFLTAKSTVFSQNAPLFKKL